MAWGEVRGELDAPVATTNSLAILPLFLISVSVLLEDELTLLSLPFSAAMDRVFETCRLGDRGGEVGEEGRW